MNISEEVDKASQTGNAIIKAIGVGRGGCQAVEYLAKLKLYVDDCICADTDAKFLGELRSSTLLPLSVSFSQDIDAQLNYEEILQTARDEDSVRKILLGTELVFILAVMGEGAGSAPIIAQIAREMNIAALSVITEPLTAEAKEHMRMVKANWGSIAPFITTTCAESPDIFGKASKNNAFRIDDDVLLMVVNDISRIIKGQGIIGVDFYDVRSIFMEPGRAKISVGVAEGEDRASQAINIVIEQMQLYLRDARGILISIVVGLDMRLSEYTVVGDMLSQFISADASVVLGAVLEPIMGKAMRVTVVATGL